MVVSFCIRFGVLVTSAKDVGVNQTVLPVLVVVVVVFDSLIIVTYPYVFVVMFEKWYCGCCCYCGKVFKKQFCNKSVALLQVSDTIVGRTMGEVEGPGDKFWVHNDYVGRMDRTDCSLCVLCHEIGKESMRVRGVDICCICW